jgi:predicted enzyme related to lactoylglutathione lyase
MPEVTSYETGQPTWADVTTPDVHGAARFYSDLFGWEANTDPRPEAGGYTMFTRNGKNVAAASPPMQEGMPPHWTVYLAADDVDAVAGRIRDAGGNVLMDPFDVFDAGRMTVAVDPSGAVFGVWQAGLHIGAQLRAEPGTITWAEAQSTDAERARPFYERVFGSEVEVADSGPAAGYVVFKVDGEPACGLVQIGDDWGPVPSHWSVVFQVEDCDAAVARARELGGSLLREPTSLEGIGRFAVVADPFGAPFQVIA